MPNSMAAAAMGQLTRTGSSCKGTWDWKHQLEVIYRHAPVWSQNLGISLYGVVYARERLGGVFTNQVTEFRARDRWSPGRMQAFLEQQLRAVLLHAFHEVPFYSQTWRAAGFSDQYFEQLTVSDLSRIPVTPKSELVRNADAFIARDIAARRRLHRYYSSGSTGTPVTSILSAEDHQKFIAAREVRSFGWAGTSLREPRATLGGRLVVPRAHSRPPYYRYNWAERQVYLSAFHISPGHVHSYVEGLRRYRPRVLTGYAHSYYTLACMMLEQRLQLGYTPAALVLSSEKLTAEMKTVIQTAFGARAYEEYGSVENCGLATECEKGRLHISPDFGIVEIVDRQGQSVPFGEEGRIVCTGLLAEAQPLIRYDIGDVGAFCKSKCPCGRDHLPVLREISGRAEDVIIGPDGREMVRFHGLFIGLPNVLEAQVIQEQLDYIRVRIVAKPGFDNDEQRLICRRLKERLGEVRVAVERVTAIERTERGKFCAVISRLDVKIRPASRTKIPESPTS